MDRSVTPPPIRRIVIGNEPTTVEPPPPGATPTNGGAAPAAPFVGMKRRRGASTGGQERMRTERLTVSYGAKAAVKEVDLPIRQGEVLALIGPSGCGKTTLLRTLNRLTELTPTASWSGRITLDNEDVDRLEVTQLRRRVSMVFQQPNPFPMSIADNVAYALREQGAKRPKRTELEPQVVDALGRAGLYDEVAQNLDHPALRLSGGQQQRLCIARALAAGPEVLLLDEPTSALDPRSSTVIEELLATLKQEVAVVIVTHNLQQAYRVADHVAFMYLGDLVEYAPVDRMFGAPRQQRTKDYVGGAFG
jgi:phosphate transport system ATP-binding protein